MPSRDERLEDDEEGVPWYDDDNFMSALVLTPRAPFLKWVREVLPDEPRPPETVVVLTPELPTDEHRSRWLEQHWEEVFGMQLRPFADDVATWPADRSLHLFGEWFDLTWSAAVDDFRDRPLGPPVSCGPVSLTALRDEFVSLVEGSELFLDVRTGDMVSFSPAELQALNEEPPAASDLTDDAIAEVRRLYAVESLVALPSPSASLTLAVMGAFAEEMRVPAVRNRLLNALDSKKPERRFLEAIDASGLRKAWVAYSQQAILDAMRETLDAYRVPYIGATEGADDGSLATRQAPSSRR